MALNLEDQLGYNLNRTAMLFRRELIRALRPYEGMTPEQWQTLNVLWQSETALSPSEIREITLQDLPSISRMIKRMEDNGWIKRGADATDKRSFRVELTPSGRKLEKEVPPALLGHFQEILGPLSEAETRALLKSLKKLRKQMEDSD